MDIPRTTAKRNRRLRRFLYTVLGVGGIAGITVALARLEPAAPTVDRATVWTDTVKRGLMVRQVRGPGTLVPKEIRWVSATTEGRVERTLVEAGTEVKADTVLLVLSNPELSQIAQDAGFQLKAAEAEYTNQKVQLQSHLLDLEAAVAAIEADYEQSKLQGEADQELAKDGLVSELNLKLSSLRTRQLETRHKIEQKRLKISAESVKAQMAVQDLRLEQLRALYELRQSQLASLQVRAGIGGVLQQLPVEVGQRVTPGTTLAKVARPDRLKAELRVAETQARDIQKGQRATIDTRNGIIEGRVQRIDPAVQQGTVLVDVELEGELPRGARPDLSVDGTVEIERLEDVLYVGRPAYGQAESLVGLFKLDAQEQNAVRISVRLGRSSVNTMEIVQGLQEGDQVILSDMSAWDGYDRVQLD